MLRRPLASFLCVDLSRPQLQCVHQQLCAARCCVSRGCSQGLLRGPGNRNTVLESLPDVSKRLSCKRVGSLRLVVGHCHWVGGQRRAIRKRRYRCLGAQKRCLLLRRLRTARWSKARAVAALPACSRLAPRCPYFSKRFWGPKLLGAEASRVFRCWLAGGRNVSVVPALARFL